MSIRTAAINGRTETARYNDLIEYNDFETGKLHYGVVRDIYRGTGGNIYLALSGGGYVAAYDARRAKPLVTIRPGSDVTIQADLVVAGRRICASTTVQVTAWRGGTAAIVVGGQLPGVAVPQADLVGALIPGKDQRLVVFKR